MPSYLRLGPTVWQQKIVSFPESGIQGLQISVECKIDNQTVALHGGAMLGDLEMELGIYSGQITSEMQQQMSLQKDAIGGLGRSQHDDGEDFVHGWLYLIPENHKAIWDEVRAGGYFDCVITLGIEPFLADTWDGTTLSIVNASVDFTRMISPPQTNRRHWFGRC